MAVKRCGSDRIWLHLFIFRRFLEKNPENIEDFVVVVVRNKSSNGTLKQQLHVSLERAEYF